MATAPQIKETLRKHAISSMGRWRSELDQLNKGIAWGAVMSAWKARAISFDERCAMIDELIGAASAPLAATQHDEVLA